MANVNWYEDSKYLPDVKKTLQPAEAAYALREAWKRIYGNYPSDKSLAVLWAKSCLETGWWKEIHCFNFGNIKKKRKSKYSPDDGHYFTMYRCSEILLDKNTGKRKEYWFDPPHYQTHFRAYKTVEDGAEDYIKFVSQKKRYAKAWREVINGDPKAYSHELKVAGYYTASESLYTAGVVKLFNSFLSKKEEYLSWKPTVEEDDIPTVPDPVIDPEEDVDTVVDNNIPEPFLAEIERTIPNLPTEQDDIKTLPSPEGKSKTKGVVWMVGFASIAALVANLFQNCN